MSRKKSESQRALEAAYRKERKRVLQLIRRNEQRGIIFDEQIPAIPKKITMGSINRLKKIDKNYLKDHATGIDVETGEIISVGKVLQKRQKKANEKREKTRQKNLVQKLTPDELRELEKQKKELREKNGAKVVDINKIIKEKGKYKVDSRLWTEEELAIREFRAFIATVNAMAHKKLTDWLDSLLKQYDEQIVGKMLIEARKAGFVFDYKVLYDEKKLVKRIAEFMTFLKAPQKEIDEILKTLEPEQNGVNPDLY